MIPFENAAIRDMSNRRHYVIAGETFSANLGDGVIAETLAYLIDKAAPDASTAFADISGKTGWATTITNAEDSKPAISDSRLAPRLNNIVRWHLVRKGRARAIWQPQLDEAAALIVGGGQLLMDNNLDFPLKIHGIVRAASDRGLPIHFVACGVHPHWSARATRLFRDALERAQTVSVRDPASAEALRRLVPSVDPRIVFDPAIWAADLYGGERPEPDRAVVGLGVIGLATVNRRRDVALRESQLLTLWLEIIRSLTEQGQAFEVFTNGNPDDQSTARRLAQQAREVHGLHCPVAPRPRRPAELAALIAGYTAVIASRLHANIIAASYGIPAVGLSWDKKVDAFHDAIGRPSFSLDLANIQPAGVMAALREAGAGGLDPALVMACRASALNGVKPVLLEPAK